MTQPRHLDKTPNPPDADGLYGVDIVPADATAFEAFLCARLEEVAARYRPSTPEARMAQALHEAAGARIDDLRDHAQSDRPEDIKRRMSAWNALVCLTEPWRGIEGHDGERWRIVTYADR